MQNTAAPSGHSFYQANNQFTARVIAGETLLIPLGSAVQQLNGMVMLNETAAFLWEQLQKPMTSCDLVQSLLNEFETEPETAASDVRAFLDTGLRNHLIFCMEQGGI